MRILYAATDQAVPGSKGGSTHVAAVADGLAALGHEVHAAVTAGGAFPSKQRVHWHALAPPLHRPNLRLLALPAVRRLARHIRPDVVIERYHNFGGEGLLAARDVKAFSVLEVNSPVVDLPRSPKRLFDRALLFEPMRRWRDWQCRTAGLIVAPTRTILPGWVDDQKILEIEWGADTSRFAPDASGPARFGRRNGETVVVFAGAFRAWHGVVHLVDAMARLERAGRPVRAVLIGDGPEAADVRAAIARYGLRSVGLTGAIPYDQMPAALAAADIGAAPFDPAAHPPLRETFYWSPLKVFEYMASGLPVVAPDIPRLRGLIGEAGLLYDPTDHPAALATAIEALLDPERRTTMSLQARDRAVRLYSWDRHCRMLAEAIGRRMRVQG